MKNILCIDIGGTRIKSAILWDNMDFQSLKKADVKILMSLGWLNNSLPQIISKAHPYSLVNQFNLQNSYDSVSVSVPAKVINNNTEIIGHLVENMGLPCNLKEAFEEQAGCEVRIFNDAVSWLNGTLNYYKLISVDIEFPCFIMALGTGVGIAFSEHLNHAEDIGFDMLYSHFPNLSRASNQIIDKVWKIHSCLGEKYFSWIKSEQKHWTYLNIQENYTNKVLSFFMDLKQRNFSDFRNIKTIFIGGRNAEYLNKNVLAKKLNKKVYVLSSSYLQINPDLVPLLGQIKLNLIPLHVTT